MASKLFNSLFLCTSLFLCSCVSQFKKADVSTRGPAAVAVTTVPSKDIWVFTWTNRDQAVKNPDDFMKSSVDNTLSCFQKLAKTEDLVKGCDEDLFAGPGLYTCDNPFTSHDYGKILLAFRSKATQNLVVNGNTEEVLDTQAGVIREVYANPAHPAIIYPFRSNQAVVYRKTDLFTPGQSYSMDFRKISYQSLAKHEPFRCSEQTSVQEVLQKWGDQIELLSLGFNLIFEPTGEGYIHQNTLTVAGVAAAVAAQAVAIPDADFAKRLSLLMKTYSEVRESMDKNSCLETGTVSPSSCLTQRLFQSILANPGSTRYPTYSWTRATTFKVLKSLGYLQNIKAVTSDEELQKILQKEFFSKPAQASRALEAIECGQLVKAQATRDGFESWLPAL